jgi:hypothetical protein
VSAHSRPGSARSIIDEDRDNRHSLERILPARGLAQALRDVLSGGVQRPMASPMPLGASGDVVCAACVGDASWCAFPAIVSGKSLRAQSARCLRSCVLAAIPEDST